MSKKEKLSEIEEDSQDEVSLIDLFLTLWKHKVLIILITIITAAGSVVYALFQENIYTAKTTVMPITSEKGSSLSQYAGLAAMAGVSLPGGGSSTPTQKIIALLKSRTLAERVVKDLELVPVILKNPEKIQKRTPINVAIETFQKDILAVSEDVKTTIISVNVDFKDQSYSMSIANKVVEVLEEILNEKNLTASRKSNKILEQQIFDQEKKVREYQTKMAQFQTDTKIISPEGQVTSAMTLYATLLEQKLRLQVDLTTLENALSSDNPRVTTVKSQLDEVEKQIKNIESKTGVGSFSIGAAPEQIVEYQNIYRDLEIATKLYSGLLATYENQKLQEAGDQLFIEVIDPAIFPEIKSKPSRSMICIVGTMAGFFVAVLGVFGLEALKKARAELREKGVLKA